MSTHVVPDSQKIETKNLQLFQSTENPSHPRPGPIFDGFPDGRAFLVGS